MTPTVRDFRPSDAKAVAELRRAARPFLLATPQGVAWEVATAPAARRLRLFVATDGRTRYSSAMTGTRRAFRGRGLARLAKTASLHRARDAGYTEVVTGNDAANAPMLAVNHAFGYRPFAGEWRYVRELRRD